MNKEYLQLFMEKAGFPEEARQEITKNTGILTEAGQEEALDGAVEFFAENDYSVSAVKPLIEETSQAAGLSPYTLWLLLLIESSQPMIETFRAEGKEQVFWDTFTDLRYKLIECKTIHNVWGNFVAFWYPIFYTGDIVKLGRLEYENCTFEWDTPYEKNGYAVKKGDKIKSIHIPSSKEPFDKAARLASYKKAYEYFKDELNGGPLVCVCHSWLLYPDYAPLLSPDSNILSFQGDFDIVGKDVDDEFGDGWRLYGADWEKPLNELPERTSMQRSFKQYFINGGKPGEGRGILIFDGEKIVNQ